MFSKAGRFAEQVATGASRRQFLGRFGRGALALATAVGGLVALPAVSSGYGNPHYICPAGSWWSCVGAEVGTPCDPHATCQRLQGSDLCGCVCKGRDCP